MSRQNKDMPKPDGQEIESVKKISEVVQYSDLTDDGGASGSVDLSETLPDGAYVIGSRVRVLTAFDGTNPDIQIGTGSDADRYLTTDVGVGSTGEKDAGAVSGQKAHGSETTPQVTIGEDTDFANISQGVVHVQILYV